MRETGKKPIPENESDLRDKFPERLLFPNKIREQEAKPKKCHPQYKGASVVYTV